MVKESLSTSVAEWILTTATGKERSGEVIGDLLEQRTTAFALWLSVVRIVFTVQWRWLVALPAAGFAVLLELTPFTTIFVAREFAHGFADGLAGNPHLQTSGNFPQLLPAAITVGVYIGVIAASLWSVAALALLRYGLRSSIGRLSGLLAFFFTIGSCCMWTQHAVVVVPAALSVILALVLSDRHGRRALGSIAATCAAYWCAFMILASLLAHVILIGGAKEVNLISLCGYSTCVLIEAWVLAQSRRWVTSNV